MTRNSALAEVAIDEFSDDAAVKPTFWRIVRNAGLVLSFYIGISLIPLWKVVFASGAIVGGDWSTPVTSKQFDTLSASGFFLWTHQNNLFGVADAHLATPFTVLLFLMSRILSGPDIDRLFLMLTYTGAGSTIYAYARRIGVSVFPALVAGVIYITAPVFFDYSAMGWTYILLSFSLIPWILVLFERCLKRGGLFPMILLGLLMDLGFSFSLSAIVWYPLALLIYSAFAIRSRRDIKLASLAIAVSAGLVFLLNLSWFLPFAEHGNSYLSSAASQTNVPLNQRLSVVNIFRGWGSLYNWPFENSYPAWLWSASFVPPVVAFTAILVRRRDRTVKYFAALALIPLVFFLAQPIFYRLPFTGVLRDISRLIVFEALGSAVLIAITLDWLWKARPVTIKPWLRNVPDMGTSLVTVALLLSSYPVWSGQLTGTAKNSYDIRLRTYNFPSAYTSVENSLAAKSGDAKALYLPEIHSNIPSLSQFAGPYAEIDDPFALYAPRPGGFDLGDRLPGHYHKIESLISGTQMLSGSVDVGEVLGAIGVRWVAVRRALQGHLYPTIDIINRLEADKQLVKIRDGNVVEFRNLNVLPIVYASISPVYHNGPTSADLSTALNAGFVENRRVAFFTDSADGTSNKTLLRDIADVGSYMPSITFQQINSTRYDIRVDGAQKPFFLVLLDSFNPGWHLEPVSASAALPAARPGTVREMPSKNSFVWSDAALRAPASFPATSHFIANGFANAWYVVPTKAKSTLLFRAEYVPQQVAYVGFIIELLTLITVSIVCLAIFFRWRRYHHSFQPN